MRSWRTTVPGINFVFGANILIKNGILQRVNIIPDGMKILHPYFVDGSSIDY